MNGKGANEVFHQMLAQREERREALKSDLEKVEREIESIKHTWNIYKEEQGIPDLPTMPLFDHNLSLTKKRERALIEWAEANDGILIPKKAKHTLIDAGLLNRGEGASWIVYGVIGNMKCWEKIKPGEYRLLKSDAHDQDTANVE